MTTIAIQNPIQVVLAFIPQLQYILYMYTVTFTFTLFKSTCTLFLTCYCVEEHQVVKVAYFSSDPFLSHV